MKKLLIVLSVFALCLFSFSYSQAYTINFDVLPNGTPVPGYIPISDQYADYGVMFSSNGIAGNLPYTLPAVIYYNGFPTYTSYPNSLGGDYGRPWWDIYMDFLSPYTGTVDFALMQCGLIDVTAEILDSDGQVLDSVSFSNPGDRIGELHMVSLTGSNISRLNVLNTWGGGSTTGFLIDDISFNENGGVVPEPASLSLLGLGLLGFVFKRRKTA